MIISYDEVINLNLWWKINNLLKIKDKFNIPKWFIISDFSFNNKELNNFYFKNINSDFYICRSSMNNEDSKKISYAGLFESIEWKYTDNNLVLDIKEVFDSLNNNFLDEYEEKILWEKINNREMNVLVQEFIVWDISWVYFSNYNWSRLIEYVKWCNQFLVDGFVNSNKIVLDFNYNIFKHIKTNQYKYIWENLDIFIYNKENNCLNESMMIFLIKELKRLREFFDFEIDVEWTIKDGKLFILQVRPITI